MEKNEFFRKATMCICGNLEIEKALYNTLLFLKQHMPVDSIYLEWYDPGLKAMRVIAEASSEGGKETNWITPISGEAMKQFRHLTKSMKSDVYLTQIPAGELLTLEMLEFLKVKASSLMVLKLDSDGILIGTVVFISKSGNFSENNSDLVLSLKEPFVIAMSNMLKNKELMQLKNTLIDNNQYLRQKILQMEGSEIIGANYGLKDVTEKVRHVSALDSPVLLLGETGVGKDIIANAIHYSSTRREGPYIKVNCGAIPETLIDSELFGHEKGAFTGAISQKRGHFERADKGTIFLDEIGELPANVQVRLLHILQDKEIIRVGGNKSIKLDIRIIAATNRNLEDMVKKRDFREDLWFRLNVFPVWIPPLRQRKSDIPALVQHFILKKSKELKLAEIPTLEDNAIDTLLNYDWPGNVRELENIVERALILYPNGPVRFDNSINAFSGMDDIISEDYPIKTLDESIASHIYHALQLTNGKIHGKGGTAELLGVNPTTLRSRMEKLGIRYSRNKQI